MSKACVIYNPAAGRGRTLRELHKVRSQFRDHTYWPSQRPGHAEELALRAVDEGFTTVIAAGGDGTVHDVANGVLRSDDPEVVFSVWPLGSSNDYAFTLGLSEGWRTPNRKLPREIRRVDVGRATSPDGRQRWFVNGFGMGFNGAITLESRRIPLMRGLPLYATALLKALWKRFDRPIVRVKFDDQEREVPTLGLTVNLAQREGGFPLMPLASLEDGQFDCMHVGPLTRREVIGFLPAMATGTLPTDYPNLWMHQCSRVSLSANEPVRVHLDGEFFCHPEDAVREIEVELVPKRLRVETFSANNGFRSSTKPDN